MLNNTVKSLVNAKSTLKLRTMTPMLIFGLNFDPSYGNDPWDSNWFEKMGDNLKELKPNIITAVPRLYEKVYDKIVI